MAKKPSPNRWEWIAGSAHVLRNLAAAAFFLSATWSNVGQANDEEPLRLEQPEWCNGLMRVERGSR
jgi:hypothetical protein